MEIVKAFESNNLNIQINILGTHENPLFRASDIGLILEVSNIRSSIQDFDDSEKVVHKADTLGGQQEVTFLTEKGLYQLLFLSRKPIAKQFKNWVFEVIKEIRLNGSYKLKKEIEQLSNEKEKLIENSEKEKEKLLEETLLEQFPPNTQCVYYGLTDEKSATNETLIKFGNSNDLGTRIKDHKTVYKNFRLHSAFKVSNQIEIENCIKQHKILKTKIRSKIINGKNRIELLAIDKFTLEEIDQMIKNIIIETEYNIENYNKLINKNSELENKIKNLQEEITKLNQENEKIKKEATHNTLDEKRCTIYTKPTTFTETGFLLYVFSCNDFKHKCGIVREKDFNSREIMHKGTDPTGEMKYSLKIYHPISEKIFISVLKSNLTTLDSHTFQGSLTDITKIMNIIQKLEDILHKNKDLEFIENLFSIEKNGEKYTKLFGQLDTDPESASVNKSRRPVDQINKENGKIIATYTSLEEAGKAIGVTGTAIGIGLRNKRAVQGYLFRYAGISLEDETIEQPVVKINCNTGEQTKFSTMADAAKDANISSPGMRNRINTNVHVGNFHWIWDKNATHYKNKCEENVSNVVGIINKNTETFV
jgi:prophage antirepressor-like protein